MYRNTFIFISFLVIFAALVIGVNIGRKVAVTSESQSQTLPKISPTQPINSPMPSPVLLKYESKTCGITFSYPAKITSLEDNTQGIILSNPANPAEEVRIGCQRDIPRPALIPERIEKVRIGSATASLYHDAAEKDGKPLDKLIFTHPVNKIDIYISGIGEAFNQIVRTLQIL